MNIILQIGLGLIPGVVAALFFLLKRRAFNLNRIVFVLLLAAVSGGLVYVGIKPEKTVSVQANNSSTNVLSFAYALCGEDDYDDANDVINQYSDMFGYDEDCRLFSARMALLNGRGEDAAFLYEALCDKTELISSDSEEIKYAKDLAEGRISFATEKDNIKRTVIKEAQRAYSISGDTQDCAAAVAKVAEIDTHYYDAENDDLRSYSRTFEKLEENGNPCMQMGCVSRAKIKTYVLLEDYSEIVENLSPSSDYHELMAAAELYMSKLVRKKDFPASYNEISKEEVAAIEKALNDMYSKEAASLSLMEKKNLKTRIAAINKQMEDIPLLIIKEQLSVLADEKAGTDRSKVCLEIAKIENYFGNQSTSDAKLSEAIYSSQDNEDKEYVEAMADIISVISNDDNNTENIKNVTDYIAVMLDHSLTVDVEEKISPQYNVPQQEEETERTVATPDFSHSAVDFVSRIKSALTIGYIDTADFDKISAKIQINNDYFSSVDELKSLIKLYDCGTEIRQFDISKVSYAKSNIILLCDVSGSMYGSIVNLREAVKTFVEDCGANEDISIVTFTEYITNSIPFGSSKEDLLAFADNMWADGGTNMFDAAVECFPSFPKGNDENNILILMTDGQDNYYHSSEEIYEKIGGGALEYGVTVYTMGLGDDVDTVYLSTIADSGNGEFIYVSDSASLTSFYEMLHLQVDSQYEITFNARNKSIADGRSLEILLPTENLRDVKYYSLFDDSEISNDRGSAYKVSSASPKSIYKGKQDINVTVTGAGFTPDSEITAKLNGKLDYLLSAAYVDANSISVVVPSDVAVGTYDLEITIDGHLCILKNGLSVVTQTNLPGEVMADNAGEEE